MEQEEQRRGFEAWMLRKQYDISRDSKGYYHSTEVEGRWSVWQAALKFQSENSNFAKWIKVEDDLPSAQPGKLFSESVLITDMDSSYPHVRMSELNYDKEGSTIWSGATPTHWMHAPALPRRGNPVAVHVTPQEAAAAGLECGDTACVGCMTGEPDCIHTPVSSQEQDTETLIDRLRQLSADAQAAFESEGNTHLGNFHIGMRDAFNASSELAAQFQCASVAIAKGSVQAQQLAERLAREAMAARRALCFELDDEHVTPEEIERAIKAVYEDSKAQRAALAELHHKLRSGLAVLRCTDCMGPYGEDHSENCGRGLGAVAVDEAVPFLVATPLTDEQKDALMDWSDIERLITDYARLLINVDYWSGKQKNSAVLKPAHEARDKLRTAFSGKIVAPTDMRAHNALCSIRDTAYFDPSPSGQEYYRIAENALATIGGRDAKPHNPAKDTD